MVADDLITSTDPSDDLNIGDVIRYSCKLVYHENPFFLPIFYLQRYWPLEDIDNTRSPQLEKSNSLITATAIFYQTASCLSFLNMQCVLMFGQPVGNLPPGSATNSPDNVAISGLPSVEVSCEYLANITYLCYINLGLIE